MDAPHFETAFYFTDNISMFKCNFRFYYTFVNKKVNKTNLQIFTDI